MERRTLGKQVFGDPGVRLRLGADALNVVVVDTQLDLGSNLVDRAELPQAAD